MEKLPDCPFCGKAVHCIQNSYGGWIIEHTLPRDIRECLYIDGMQYSSREDKIRFWSTRVYSI